MISKLHLPGYPEYELGSLVEVIDETHIAWPPNDFADYAAQLRAINRDDSAPFLIIPSNLDFLIPDTYLQKDLVTHRAMTRFEICGMLVEDDNDFANHKPVHLKGFNSFRELRLISGLPGEQIVSVEATLEGSESAAEAAWEAFDFYTSAGDYEAVVRLLRAAPGLLDEDQ